MGLLRLDNLERYGQKKNILFTHRQCLDSGATGKTVSPPSFFAWMILDGAILHFSTFNEIIYITPKQRATGMEKVMISNIPSAALTGLVPIWQENTEATELRCFTPILLPIMESTEFLEINNSGNLDTLGSVIRVIEWPTTEMEIKKK